MLDSRLTRKLFFFLVPASIFELPFVRLGGTPLTIMSLKSLRKAYRLTVNNVVGCTALDYFVR